MTLPEENLITLFRAPAVPIQNTFMKEILPILIAVLQDGKILALVPSRKILALVPSGKTSAPLLSRKISAPVLSRKISAPAPPKNLYLYYLPRLLNDLLLLKKPYMHDENKKFLFSILIPF